MEKLAMIRVCSLKPGEAVWTDPARDLTHFAVGERMASHDRDTFVVWTLCGSHDVPAGQAGTFLSEGRLTAPATVDCRACGLMHQNPHPPDLDAPIDGSREWPCSTNAPRRPDAPVPDA